MKRAIEIAQQSEREWFIDLMRISTARCDCPFCALHGTAIPLLLVRNSDDAE